MIIQSARLATGLDLAALTSHVFAGPANLAITVLHGDAGTLGEMQRDAAAAGKRYAMRHIKLSPAAPMSRVEIAVTMQDIAKEFKFPLSRCVVVEHLKPRAAGGYERHWHLLVPEWDPVRRRVLDAHWTRPRQEKLARLTELRLAHPLVTGRWNAAVARAMMAVGNDEGAAAIEMLAEAVRPRSAYTGKQHQAAARRGQKLPETLALVTRAWAGADDPNALLAALAVHGMFLQAGNRDGVWLVLADQPDDAAPLLIGALHRLLHQPKRFVEARLLTLVELRPGTLNLDTANPGAA
jgi:hypothetical protein